MAQFVLVHSPVVGPTTWSGVATYLRESGHLVAVPSLLGVADGEPPCWPRVVAAVNAGLGGLGLAEPVVLVAHSNAGAFIPAIRTGLRLPVGCSIFADATVPAADGQTPISPPRFLSFLRGLAGPDERLPRWTDWWEEQDVAALFGNEDDGGRLRAAITDEQPRLPLSYFTEQVPVPDGWDDHRCGYLMYGEGYADEADEARRRGWAVRALPGEHLHQVVDPAGVAAALCDLAGVASRS
jgi:hypothetical protein